MSLIKNAKEFFGLSPVDDLTDIHDDAYYADEPRYETAGSAAYAPRTYERDYESETHPGRSTYSRAERIDYREPVRDRVNIIALDLVSYREAAEIGGPFRDGDAVVFDLSDMERDEAKRVVDFAAGLCFALSGKLEKLDARLFALTPQGAIVERAELERAARRR